MATTTNYAITGVPRKVDLYVMGAFNFSSNETQQLAPTLGAESGGQVCAGVVKIAQKVVNFLMTSGVFYDTDTDWGTAITSALCNYSPYQLQQSFGPIANAALSVTLSSLKAAETSDSPADERIARLDMLSWGYNPATSTLTLSLQLSMQSGDVTPIVVPISIVP